MSKKLVNIHTHKKRTPSNAEKQHIPISGFTSSSSSSSSAGFSTSVMLIRGEPPRMVFISTLTCTNPHPCTHCDVRFLFASSCNIHSIANEGAITSNYSTQINTAYITSCILPSCSSNMPTCKMILDSKAVERFLAIHHHVTPSWPHFDLLLHFFR